MSDGDLIRNLNLFSGCERLPEGLDRFFALALQDLNARYLGQPLGVAARQPPTFTQDRDGFVIAALPRNTVGKGQAKISALRFVQQRDPICPLRPQVTPPIVDSAEHQLPAIVLSGVFRQLLIVGLSSRLGQVV